MYSTSISPTGEDVSAMQPDIKTPWDPGKDNSSKITLSSILASAMQREDNLIDEEMTDDAKFGGTRTELDSHANMAVVGKYVYVLKTGDTVEVNPFTPKYKAITARVVDAAIRYDCPYEGQSYILIIRNVIHVPSMENNLIPPFLLREAGIIVNDKAKIHVAG